MGVLADCPNYQEFKRRLDVLFLFSSDYATSLKCLLITPDCEIKDLELISEIDSKFSVETKNLEDNFYKIDYTRKWGEGVGKGYEYIIQENSNWTVLSDDENPAILLGILKRLYHYLSFISLKSEDILALLESLENHGRDSILDIYLVVMKGRREQTDVIFKDIKIEQLKKKIEHGDILKSVLFKFKIKSGEIFQLVFDCKIDRYGLCELKKGNFEEFKDKVLTKLLQAGGKKFEFYKNRSRVIEDGKTTLKPIEISLRGNLNITSIRNLSAELQNKPDLIVDVIHSGDPYYLAHVIDRNDGSIYDIGATDRSIFVIPTLNSSATSLIKIREFIFERLEEGEARDYYGQEQEPSI